MTKKILSLTLITVLSAFIFFSVYDFQLVSNTKTNPQKNSSLIRIIENLEAELIVDQQRLDQLQIQINDIEALTYNKIENVQNLKNELAKHQKAAGLTALKGSGIKIVLDDNKDGHEENPENNPNNYIVHYESLLALVEELKRAGAEAMSINGHRLITTSDIRCVGNVILINTGRIAPPFEISAIGNPILLEKYIVNSSEYDYLITSLIPISYQLFTDNNVLTVPSYKNNISFTYAQIDN